MDFEKYLKTTVKQLDREVDKILKYQLKLAAGTDKKLVPLMKAFAKSCRGGKGLRGTLVILGYEIAQGKGEENVIPNKVRNLPSSSTVQPGKIASLPSVARNDVIRIAAAYEIMHTAILAHDDIIDQSLKRRGQPSLYQALGNNHYGISQAISLADFGFFLSFKIISKSSFPPEVKNKAMEAFSQVMMDTTWGELLDLEETDPVTVMKLKTAWYTIAGPLQIGAILAGAGENLLGRLELFGESLGLAYQIRDDLLDSENKSQEKAEKYTDMAMKILPRITKDENMSKLLEQMANYLVERTK